VSAFTPRPSTHASARSDDAHVKAPERRQNAVGAFEEDLYDGAVGKRALDEVHEIGEARDWAATTLMPCPPIGPHKPRVATCR